MWILWIITLKSTVLPVSGSVVWGEWHRTHSLTSWREPPCAESGIVAGVAGAVRDHVPDRGHGRAVGDEVILDVGVVVLADDGGGGARGVDPESRRDGLVVTGGQRRLEGVDGVADVEVVPGAAGIGASLRCGDVRDRARLDARRVGRVVARDGIPPRQDEAHRDRARSDRAGAVEGNAAVVRVGDVDDRVQPGVERDAVDGDLQARPDVGELVGREPELFLLGSVQGLRVVGLGGARHARRAE